MSWRLFARAAHVVTGLQPHTARFGAALGRQAVLSDPWEVKNAYRAGGFPKWHTALPLCQGLGSFLEGSLPL